MVESGGFEVLVDGSKVGTIGEGGVFGELALMYDAPRAATIQCNQAPAKLWALDRTTFRHTLASTFQSQSQQNMEAIKSVELLSTLTHPQMLTMADALQAVKFRKGERIIQKGEQGSIFYIIKTGSVVCKNIGSGQLADVRLHAGDYFGERALLLNEPRAANVIAESDTECMVLDRESFNDMLGG